MWRRLGDWQLGYVAPVRYRYTINNVLPRYNGLPHIFCSCHDCRSHRGHIEFNFSVWGAALRGVCFPIINMSVTIIVVRRIHERRRPSRLGWYVLKSSCTRRQGEKYQTLSPTALTATSPNPSPLTVRKWLFTNLWDCSVGLSIGLIGFHHTFVGPWHL